MKCIKKELSRSKEIQQIWRPTELKTCCFDYAKKTIMIRKLKKRYILHQCKFNLREKQKDKNHFLTPAT